MKWHITHGDVLDVPADVLIFSGNINLHLSGGVGAAFLLRFGEELQTFLLRWLRDSGRRMASAGEFVVCPPCG